MDEGSVTTWKLHPKGIAVDIRYMHTRVHDDRMIHGKQGGTALMRRPSRGRGTPFRSLKENETG